MIKISIGNAYPFDEEVRSYEVKGRDLIAGAIEVTSDEIREALSDPISEVIEAIKISLGKLHLNLLQILLITVLF